MYIIINGTRYENAVRSKRDAGVTFLAAGLPEGLSAEGTVGSYRNDGFLLCEDDAAGYARQESRQGVLILTNEPEPAGPETDDRPTWAELAGAIQEGVESV